jgi:hypothetical protein
LSELVEPSPPTLRRDRSPAARNAARRRKADRERRIIGFLNRGVSVAELAARERVTERGMRKYVRGLLARRAPQPPAEFLARLNEALLVAYSAMSGANLQAVDRANSTAITVLLSPTRARREGRPVSHRLPWPLSRSRRRAPGRNRMSPQSIETARFASRNGSPFSATRGRWPEGPDGVQKAGLDRCRFAVAVVQSDLRRSSGPHPIRRFAPPSPAELGKGSRL